MTNDDELLKHLDKWAQTDMGNVFCMIDCRAAAARIRDLKAQLAVFMPVENKEGYASTHIYVPVELVSEAEFLLNRIAEWSASELTDENARGWIGHVDPSVERLRAMIRAAQGATGGISSTPEQEGSP